MKKLFTAVIVSLMVFAPVSSFTSTASSPKPVDCYKPVIPKPVICTFVRPEPCPVPKPITTVISNTSSVSNYNFSKITAGQTFNSSSNSYSSYTQGPCGTFTSTTGSSSSSSYSSFSESIHQSVSIIKNTQTFSIR